MSDHSHCASRAVTSDWHRLLLLAQVTLYYQCVVGECLPFSFLWLNWNNELSESLDLSTLTWAAWPRFRKSEDVGEDVRMTCLGWCSSTSLSPDVPAGLWCGPQQLGSSTWQIPGLSDVLGFYCGDEHGIQVAQLKWLQKQSLDAIFHALCLAKPVGWQPTDLSCSWKASEIQTFECSPSAALWATFHTMVKFRLWAVKCSMCNADGAAWHTFGL